ncbi:hypothetical protein AU468_02165 [Alkalispirochaeta sphaeroplastigenens]|uniref:Uncharacterized protein n=2 Tax=Alkalispirochaeta sphaeroplastigenens TaxID=1187066 RepID=A0A2S4K072_9SPIO|nr:hypothetical protein AU468_02165 [Alkalispirochaeta sphaeroplastigenens]
MFSARSPVRVLSGLFSGLFLCGWGVLLPAGLSSCDTVFEGNLFENFAGPESASAILKKYSDGGSIPTARAPGFVSALDDAAGSPRFFRELSASDRAGLNEALESVYTADDNDVPKATRQKAAILAGQVNLRETAAGETVNNAIDVLTDGGIDTFEEDPEALLDQLLPSGVRGDQAKIAAVLNDLVNAAGAYEALGATLEASPGDPDPQMPAGTNKGAVAQNALVALVVKDIAKANGAGDAEAGIAALAAELAKPQGTRDPIVLPYDNGEEFAPEGSPLRNIFNAAGFGGVLDDV